MNKKLLKKAKSILSEKYTDCFLDEYSIKEIKAFLNLLIFYIQPILYGFDSPDKIEQKMSMYIGLRMATKFPKKLKMFPDELQKAFYRMEQQVKKAEDALK